jgi:hypothetical protein
VLCHGFHALSNVLTGNKVSFLAILRDFFQ